MIVERGFSAPQAERRADMRFRPGGFRPDAALLPLLPVEDHPTFCDCDACIRHARSGNDR